MARENVVTEGNREMGGDLRNRGSHFIPKKEHRKGKAEHKI